jgi:hypothetical protein
MDYYWHQIRRAEQVSLNSCNRNWRTSTFACSVARSLYSAAVMFVTMDIVHGVQAYGVVV